MTFSLKLPEVSGDFRRLLQVQNKLSVGIRGEPFSPVCSRSFPQETGARTPYSSTLLMLALATARESLPHYSHLVVMCLCAVLVVMCCMCVMCYVVQLLYCCHDSYVVQLFLMFCVSVCDCVMLCTLHTPADITGPPFRDDPAALVHHLLCVYIYIYIQREREIHIHTHIHIYIHISLY